MDKTIQFHTQDISYSLKQRNAIRHWLISLIHSEEKKPGEINFIYCSDQFLHQLNKNYLQHDTFTDIITFDYNENKLISGDIFISIDRTRENAKKFGSSHKNELHRVMAHGVLHLLGYKDKTPEQKRKMTQMENLWLERRSF